MKEVRHGSVDVCAAGFTNTESRAEVSADRGHIGCFNAVVSIGSFRRRFPVAA